MNIRCPHCQTTFRVNPERIPSSGVRARCARCGDTFLVSRPPETGTPPPASSSGLSADRSATTTTPPAVATLPAQPTTRSSSSPRQETRAAPPRSQDRPRDASPSTPVPTGPQPGDTAGPAVTSVAAAATPVFGTRDPKAKAERLARALVSDIVAYHPDRRDRSLESGSLRTEFRDEIMKSWEEYVAQVGLELAKSTPYFRDALNTILARGQKVF